MTPSAHATVQHRAGPGPPYKQGGPIHIEFHELILVDRHMGVPALPVAGDD